MIDVIYFDEGEYKKEWDDVIQRGPKLGYNFIAVKSFKELTKYIGLNTLIYTVPSSEKDWMLPTEEGGRPITKIIIGPDRTSLSTWLVKNKEMTSFCRFRIIKDNHSAVRSAYKVARIILNG